MCGRQITRPCVTERTVSPPTSRPRRRQNSSLLTSARPRCMMAIDGAHIRAAHGYQSRHIDVTVGKIEVAGRKPRRFALAPKGASAPLATLRKALREQGWRPGQTVTVLSDGESALPGLVRAAVDEPVTCILDWWHISMRVQHIEQALRGVYAAEPQHRAGLEIVERRIGRLQASHLERLSRRGPSRAVWNASYGFRGRLSERREISLAHRRHLWN